MVESYHSISRHRSTVNWIGLRLALLVPWSGMQTRLTPLAFAAAWFPTGIEASVSRDQARDASQLCRMYLDRRDQQIRVMRPMRTHLVINDNLVFRLL